MDELLALAFAFTIAFIAVKLNNIERKLSNMAGELDALTAEVANNTTVEKSALALIQGFAAQLAAAGTDPVKLQALADTLKANDTELAAAVAQNTPAAPAP
jgi:hypothetical protein